MCALLGIAFNQPVLPSLSFRGLRHRAGSNPHGWGLATFPDGSAQIFKEPIHGRDSKLARFIRDYRHIESKIFIGHVRYGNVGGQALANTHPFCREIRGRHFVFAHNGTLKTENLRRRLDGRFTPVGKTDSEDAMCSLLTWMVQEDIAFTDFKRIKTWLLELNQYGNMNLLFSEGHHLFIYHDASGYNGLCFTHRKAPFQRVSLRDEDWEVNLAEEKHPDQRGYVIATKPLTDEEWTNFAQGSLCVIKNGELVYKG